MNHIFLFIAGFLLLLGLYPFLKRRSLLSTVFMVQNGGLALWNICFYLQKESLYFLDVNLVSQLQLVSALVFTNGFYLLSYLYPSHARSISYRINLAVLAALSVGIFFTDFVSYATLVDGELVFIDGPGYALYGLYLIGLVLFALVNLYRNYRRHEEHRTSILLVAFGIAVFALVGLIFGFVLPLFGNFNFLDYSTLGAIFPLMFFAYAITKHDFLDLSVIINKAMAWALTLLLVAGSIAITWFWMVDRHPVIGAGALMLLGMLWAVAALPLQQFLLTSAKRKFIRGWYDPEEVLSLLSDRIEDEKSREAIFMSIDRILDKVLELEQHQVVVAVRDNEERLSHYQILNPVGPGATTQLPVSHPLIAQAGGDESVCFLDEYDDKARQFLLGQGYQEGRRCVVIALHSPELLEGLLLLGERSSQAVYTAADLRFFRRLANYMSAIFYRLTPMEKLERIYFENVQRLHEAEIQLIRAQKIESIVHATRQCHHEIRTPLNIIRLGLGRVKDLEGLKAYKQIAEEEIAHALEIVDETLMITDVEQPSMERRNLINLNDAIRRSIKLVPEDRIVVHAALEGEIPVNGVFSDLQVVFANLIHNAADAMPHGGAITIRSRCADKLAIVEFSDTGKGIAEEQRERVWEPYFSGHATVAGNSTAGRGWGLTIVNRIIGEHEGTINFTSVVGEGTTFTIKLPLAQEKAGKEHMAKESAPRENLAKDNAGKESAVNERGTQVPAVVAASTRSIAGQR